MQRAYLWPTVLILSTVSVLLSQKLIIPVVSPLLIAWFFLVCPGLAIVGLLPVKQVGVQAGLIFALSIALNTILAEILAFAHLWSPDTALFLLICFTTSCAILQLMRTAIEGEPNDSVHEQHLLPLRDAVTSASAYPHLLEQKQTDQFELARQIFNQTKAQQRSPATVSAHQS